MAAHAIRNHEGSCTNNPNRYCRLCERKSIYELIEGYKKRFVMHPAIQEDHEGNYMGDYFNVEWIGEPVTMDEVRKVVDNCPNCVFSILRQCKFNYKCFDFPAFDYKKELDVALREKKDDEMKEEYYANIW